MTQHAVTAISPSRANSPQTKRTIAINAVRNACLGSGVLKAVALALAQLTNDENGDCWPSVQLVADWTDFTRRTVQKSLRQLEKCGAIHSEGTRSGGRQQTTHYRLNLGWFEARARHKNEPQNSEPRSPIREVNSVPRAPFNGDKGRTTDAVMVPERVNVVPERANLSTEKGVPRSPEVYRSVSKYKTTTTEEVAPDELREGLKQVVPIIDQKAVSRLWAECRAKAPDCTVSEVLEVVRASDLGGKHSPVGFLLTVVPNFFEGSSLQDFRERQAKRRKSVIQIAEEAITEQNDSLAEAKAYQEAKASLNDSMTPEEYEQHRREYIKRIPQAISWSPDMLRKSVIADLLKKRG